MNGKKARRLRKEIYGDDFSQRYRQYYRHKAHRMRIADEKRRAYQNLKEETYER